MASHPRWRLVNNKLEQIPEAELAAIEQRRWDDVVAKVQKLIQSGNPRVKVAGVPGSLRAGENTLHFDRVAALFATIRQDCDATAASLGLANEDGGLAAVEYLAEAVIAAVRLERNEQPHPSPRRKSGPHESTVGLKRVWDATYKRKKEYLYAKPSKLNEWIAEIDEVLRLRRTKEGKPISPSEAKEIRAYLNRLAQRVAGIKSGKIKIPARGQVREELSEHLVATGLYGKPRDGQDAYTFVKDKLKRAGRAPRKK